MKHDRNMTPQDIASRIDHTLLAMDATEMQIRQLCKEASEYGFYAVCVNSGYVPLARHALAGSKVKVCSVVGFPLGACLSSVKAFEANAAIAAGADEIDMVVNVGWVKSAQWDAVTEDIRQVILACGKTPLKVILENCLLTRDELVRLCQICKTLQVAFVKTSTGFSRGGALVKDVALMRETVGPYIGVKASGGVGTAEIARSMISAGASRIGTSSGIAIVAGENDIAAQANRCY